MTWKSSHYRWGQCRLQMRPSTELCNGHQTWSQTSSGGKTQTVMLIPSSNSFLLYSVLCFYLLSFYHLSSIHPLSNLLYRHSLGSSQTPYCKGLLNRSPTSILNCCLPILLLSLPLNSNWLPPWSYTEQGASQMMTRTNKMWLFLLFRKKVTSSDLIVYVKHVNTGYTTEYRGLI